MLWAVGISPTAEDCGRWEYRGGGEWERVEQGANQDGADAAVQRYKLTSAPGVVM